MARIAVIDYGMGNLRSVAKALEYVAAADSQVRVTQDPDDILTADRVVFPGQGAIDGCMRELGRLHLVDAVRRAARSKPFLGLCLGPQALLDFSEENNGVYCLGILPGTILAAVSASKSPIWVGTGCTRLKPTLCGKVFPKTAIFISCIATT